MKDEKDSKDRVVKQIELENQQILLLHDLSRKIGEDAWQVVLKASIDIPVKKEVLQAYEEYSALDGKFEDIVATLGETIVYEHRVERNFILDREKEGVLEDLMNTFLKTLGPYVAKPVFPGKFILKTYGDRKK